MDLIISAAQAAELAALVADTRPAPLTGPQAQGDLLVLPVPGHALPYTAQPLRDGAVVPLVTTGNGHQLRAVVRPGGSVVWAPVWSGPSLGGFEVHGDAHVVIEQPRGLDRHDPLGVGPGVYQVLRQTSPDLHLVQRPGWAWD